MFPRPAWRGLEEGMIVPMMSAGRYCRVLDMTQRPDRSPAEYVGVSTTEPLIPGVVDIPTCHRQLSDFVNTHCVENDQVLCLLRSVVCIHFL